MHGERLLAADEPAAGHAWLAWGLAQPSLYAVERRAALHRLARRGVPDSWRGRPAPDLGDAPPAQRLKREIDPPPG